VKPHIHELIHSSASLIAFFPIVFCVLSCTSRDKPSWRDQLMCVCVDNQWSRGVVIAMLWSSVRNLLHQHRDLHQSTYLYLTEDREPTSHHYGMRSLVALGLQFLWASKLFKKRITDKTFDDAKWMLTITRVVPKCRDTAGPAHLCHGTLADKHTHWATKEYMRMGYWDRSSVADLCPPCW
jgi:hypothetical protein